MDSGYLSKIQSNMKLLNDSIERTTTQVSTGKIFEEGSEDIRAYDLHMQISEDIKIFETVARDIGYGKNVLTNSEVAIDSMEDLIEHMNISLSKMATDATYNTIETGIILEEMKLAKEHLVNLANTQVNGQYIFSGSFTERPPFDINNTRINPDTLVEELVYQGDDESKEVYVDKDYKKDFSITGKDLFVDTGIFQKIDEFINLLENRVLETSKELNNYTKENNARLGSEVINDINNDLQALDYTQLTVAQKVNILDYKESLDNYIKVPSIDNYNLAQNQLNELLTPGAGAGPWNYPTELTAMFDIAEYNVSLNTYSSDEKILADFNVNQDWPINTTIQDAAKYNFEINNPEEYNNIKIDLKMFDPEGNVHIAINGQEITEIPNHAGTSEITLADLKGEFFQNGTNTLQIWSDTGDTGTLESVKVYTGSVEDLFEEKDYILETYDALLSNEQKEDMLYQYNLAMYKMDLKKYSETKDPADFDKMELSKNYINNELTQEQIEEWKYNQGDKYANTITKAASRLNMYVTQINGSPDVSLINDYTASIEKFFEEPTTANYDEVVLLKDQFLASAKTSTVIDPDLEVQNMFDYVEYIHNASTWTEQQVTGDIEKTNDYMFGLAKNPYSAKIEDLEEVRGRVSGVRGKLGVTYNYLTNMESKINNKTLELQKFYAENVEVDMAEVATKLTQQSNSMNALYSVIAKLQNLSLTNYLK